MHDPAIGARLNLALAATHEAGAIIRGYFRRDDVAVEWKSDATPVTIADREAELHLRRRISETYPDDGSLWDTAALQLILEEAGGSFTDWRGEPTIYAGEAVATNGRLLEAVLTVLRGVDD